MCDTLALNNGGPICLAKNSDREPGEAQLVVRIPAVKNDARKKLKTTYLEIEQTASRHGVILSKPFWIWGAEMGVNDRGVAIGNEAVFTKVMERQNGLIGMDLLRLGLERGDSAEDALHLIASLIERYGQGGVCGLRDRRLRYDNSFLIADPKEIWALETAGRHWAAKKIASHAAISNCLAIGADYDLHSDGLEDFARQKGLFSGKGDLNFRETFDTWLLPHFARSEQRMNSNLVFLKTLKAGQEGVLARMMANLRSHRDAAANPEKGSNADVCMHSGGFLIRRSQTCGSMALRLDEERPLYLFTGTSAPCLSVFKPASFDADIQFSVLNADERTVAGSLWQRHEHVHRRLLFLEEDRKEVQKQINDVEQRMMAILDHEGKTPTTDDFTSADAIASALDEGLYQKYQGQPCRYPPLSPYGIYWKTMNRRDGFAL
jgi:dipeptidase